MTDIWGEKPESTELWYPLAPWGIKELYFVKDMDAWLEKVKERMEEYRKWELTLHKEACDLGMKLEAIEKLKDEYKEACSDTSKPYGFVLKHIVANLEKILQSSTGSAKNE